MNFREKMNSFVMNINENIYFQTIKMTYVDIIPFLIGIGIIYVCNMFFKLPFLDTFLFIVCLIYTVLINILYAYHYITIIKENKRHYILFSILLTFMFMYSDAKGNILLITLPVLLVNILGIEIMNKVSNLQWKTKYLPESVTQYFAQLVPVIVGILFAFISIYLKDTYMPFISLLIQIVLQFLSSIVGCVIIVFLTCFCWYYGIHGVSIIGTLARPFWTQMLMVNFINLLLKEPMTYIATEGFFQWFVWIGGSGATLGLALLCRYLAKSSSLKELGKDATLSGLFNINEQIIFGLPIAENKFMKIPFFVAPITLAIITYFSMYYGLISKTFLVAPWVAPSLIGSLWASGGSLSVIGYSLILICISTIIYLPFFIKYDHYLFTNEMKGN